MTQHSRDTPQFYLTAPSPCPYLPGKEERKVFTHLVGERAAGLNTEDAERVLALEARFLRMLQDMLEAGEHGAEG